MVVRLEAGDPSVVGGFEVLGRLGAVVRGRFPGRSRSGEKVAIKLLRDQVGGDPMARVRFAHEVGAAQRVSPFCTAQVLGFDMDHEPAYIVSEFVDGPSLAEAVQARGVLTGAALHRLAIGTMTALTAIHEAGVIHRDFKPANVLLAASSQPPSPRTPPTAPPPTNCCCSCSGTPGRAWITGPCSPRLPSSPHRASRSSATRRR